MKLEDYEIKSPLWHRLKEHMESELTRLREKNDSMLDATETARVRGRIQQIKDFLSLELEPPTPPAGTVSGD